MEVQFITFAINSIKMLNCIYKTLKFTNFNVIFLQSSQVYTGVPQYIPNSDGLLATKIEMNLPLNSGHFGLRNSLLTGHANLIVRCTAKIASFYNEYTEVDIGFSQKDPIPARGNFYDYMNQALFKLMSPLKTSLNFFLFPRYLDEH